MTSAAVTGHRLPAVQHACIHACMHAGRQVAYTPVRDGVDGAEIPGIECLEAPRRVVDAVLEFTEDTDEA